MLTTSFQGHSNMASISAANAPRHPGSLKLFEAVSWVLRMQQSLRKFVEEMIRAPLDEDVEETPVDFLRDSS